MKLSCIITTRNRRATILRTLAHLETETNLSGHDWEILVVDNGSSDGTADALSRHRRVKVISLAENEGVPARNLALAHARGKYVAFLGDDIRPIGRAIPQALSYLARHPKTAAVVGRVILPDGSADAPALPTVLMGGASVVRKSVIDSIGGFASEFFHQAADYELSFRIWRAGHRIERFEDVEFSRESIYSGTPSEVACRMNLRNNLILCERYLPRPLRKAYRQDWIRRYALLARHGYHDAAANAALKEARIWARREANVGRKPLDANVLESILQLKAQRDAVAGWAKAHDIRRVCIADWGKNLFATWQACRAANLQIEAILENDSTFAKTSYRNIPITPDHATDPRSFDGILVSTVNPARVGRRAEELESRFGKPVLRLWTPRLLVVPPPSNLRDPSGTLPRKIDKAAWDSLLLPRRYDGPRMNDNPTDFEEPNPDGSWPALSNAQTANQDADEVATRIEEIPAADGADVLEEMSSEKAADVAQYLDPNTAGRILSEMDPALAASVLRDMDAPEASMVVSAMAPDDAVDVLEYLPARVHDAIVSEMEPQEAKEVRQLEQYPPDTAGGIMSPEVTALAEDLNVQQAIEELRRLSEELEQMYYVYVVDRRSHLVGVLSMRDLILARPNRVLSQIMRTQVASVPVTMDQERVAQLMRRNKYLALPVVDTRNRLIGIITADDVADVIEEEATEDMQKMFGAGAEERLLSPWHFSFRKRVWWLEVNLATAFLAAWVIAKFDSVIAALPILAAYQSVVSGMGGNAGAQTLAVSIRGIALGETAPRLLSRVLYRESLVGLLTGITVGLTTWACAAAHIFGYHQHPFALGFVIFLALVFNHVNACTTGVLIPFAMKKLGFDPAQSSTIFATTFTDCGGFFATLWLAEKFMHWLQ